MRKKVAVLLAAFNGEAWLEEQISSILVQKDVDVVVFVSIDLSDDGTEKLVKGLSRADSRIVLLPTFERFGSAGSNFFRLLKDVDLINFDYVAFSDQDDIWYCDKLIRAIDMISASSASAYSSNVVAFWDANKKVLIDKAQPQKQYDFLFEAGGPGCTYVLDRFVVDEFKSLLCSISNKVSKIYIHDWFIYAFVRSKKYLWIIDPLPSMDYRQHSSNQVGVNSGLKAIRMRAKFVTDGSAIKHARLIARLLGLENKPFCKPWRRPGRLGMLWLALNAYRARRKVSDRFVFAAVCLLLVVIGDRSDG